MVLYGSGDREIDKPCPPSTATGIKLNRWRVLQLYYYYYYYYCRSSASHSVSRFHLFPVGGQRMNEWADVVGGDRQRVWRWTDRQTEPKLLRSDLYVSTIHVDEWKKKEDEEDGLLEIVESER